MTRCAPFSGGLNASVAIALLGTLALVSTASSPAYQVFPDASTRSQCELRGGQFVYGVSVGPLRRDGPDGPLYQDVTVKDLGEPDALGWRVVRVIEKQRQNADGRQKEDWDVGDGGASYAPACIHRDRLGRLHWNDGPSAPEVTSDIAYWNNVFWDAGINHDNCYHHNLATYGITKTRCDENFLKDMLATCDKFLRGWSECEEKAVVYYEGVHLSQAAKRAWRNTGTHVDYLNKDPNVQTAFQFFLDKLPREVSDIRERPGLNPELKAILDYYAQQASYCGLDKLCVSAQHARLYRNLFYYLSLWTGEASYNAAKHSWVFPTETALVNQQVECQIWGDNGVQSGPPRLYRIGELSVETPTEGFPIKVPLWGTGIWPEGLPYPFLDLFGTQCYYRERPSPAPWYADDAAFWLKQYLDRLSFVKTHYSWPPIPVQPPVQPLSAALLRLSAGRISTCALDDVGAVGCWGYDAYGVVSPPEASFRHVSVGIFHACGLRADEMIECWGRDEYGIPATLPLQRFLQVSAGATHTCALTVDGYVKCWGTGTSDETKPPNYLFADVSAGSEFSCGLRKDGAISCWGLNDSGQSTPPSGSFTQLDAGFSHACGLRADGTVACWGSNEFGQRAAPGGTFVQVSAGGAFTCGIRTDGTLTCWGSNAFGQSLPPEGSFSQVTAGGAHACAVRESGTLVCWGYNREGQAPGGLEIEGAVASDAVTGMPYMTTLTARNGFAPYRFAMKSGALPPGLSLSAEGIMSGRPAVAGDYSFTIAVTDALTIPLYGERAFTLTVAPLSSDDRDGDAVPNASDNCPDVSNVGQIDSDADGVGDTCDDDTDGDGARNISDNCRGVSNPTQADLDSDGSGDVCDEDIDGDGVLNEWDNCLTVANADQADVNADGIGDLCEVKVVRGDLDGDGDVDKNDVNVIMAARNQAASGPNDPRDLDGDGKITVIDARRAALLCTRPSCATQ